MGWALLGELSRMMRLTRKSRDPRHRSRRSICFPKVNQALLSSRTTIWSAANERIAQNENEDVNTVGSVWGSKPSVALQSLDFTHKPKHTFPELLHEDLIEIEGSWVNLPGKFTRIQATYLQHLHPIQVLWRNKKVKPTCSRPEDDKKKQYRQIQLNNCSKMRLCHDKLAQFVIHVHLWMKPKNPCSSVFVSFVFLESIPCCLCPRNIPIITSWKTRVAKVIAWILIISFRNQFQFLVHHGCNGRIDHGKTQTAVWNTNRGDGVSQPGSSHF